MQNWSWTKSVQKSNKNQFWDGLGLYLGGVWGRLGPPLGAFDRLLAVFWAFKTELLSTIGLQEGFWIDLGSLWEGFGEVLGGFGEKFWRILDLLNT